MVAFVPSLDPQYQQPVGKLQTISPDTRQALYTIFYELQAAGLGLFIPQQKQITFWGINISVPCFPQAQN